MLPNTGWRRHGDNLTSFRKKLYLNTAAVDVFFNNTLCLKKCIEIDSNIDLKHYMKADQPAPKDTHHTHANA